MIAVQRLSDPRGGHMEVDSESEGGHVLLANYSNSTWGAMHTRWRFEISDGKITRSRPGRRNRQPHGQGGVDHSPASRGLEGQARSRIQIRGAMTALTWNRTSTPMAT